MDCLRGIRKLHSEKLRDSLLRTKHPGDQIKKNEMGGACRMYGYDERCIQVLVVKRKGKRQFGRPTCGLENIKVHLEGGGGEGGQTGMVGSRKGQVGSCECGSEPPCYIKC
jgi:hypothetical protein